MKCLLFLALITLLFSIPLNAQQPDRWRGLLLDESTPEDAIKALGTPKKDREKQPLKLFGGVDKWLTKQRKEKIFREQEFELGKKEGVQKAFLYFLDGKLVRMMLDLKSGEVSPTGLGNIYGIELQPMVGQMDLAMFSKDYERNQGKIYPKTYPTVYYLVGVSEKSFVSAMVSNVPSFMGALGKSMGVPDAPGSYPGKVEYIDLISRKLENRDGTDVLK